MIEWGVSDSAATDLGELGENSLEASPVLGACEVGLEVFCEHKVSSPQTASGLHHVGELVCPLLNVPL